MRTHSLWLTIFLAASVALVQSLSYKRAAASFGQAIVRICMRTPA